MLIRNGTIIIPVCKKKKNLHKKWKDLSFSTIKKVTSFKKGDIVKDVKEKIAENLNFVENINFLEGVQKQLFAGVIM